MKTVILHYHLFKNAGTSLDAAFKENFSEVDGEWVTKEFPAQPAVNREQVKQWIIDNPQAKCFSSHTAIFPVPIIDGIKIIPVIFMRNPIDRIASAYAFEKKQGGDGFGAVLARNTDLSGYVETRLALPNDRQCRNFHSQRFAQMFGEKQGDELNRSLLALESLPFVGIVEQFSASLEVLELLLNDNDFTVSLKAVEKNVSRSTKKTIEQKLEEIESLLGRDIYQNLIESNADDYELYKTQIGH
ncbi:sulfotransferase family 2 domain-containing protein [Shewanella benthica]|uniref:sulfotransferase family 2 domain-containing protein n=1 Tax=Shewanella benthica TaxID=43661 RepID=UPI001879D079|nr:sulfotransferase family 2 domain-containing protein [Shewanella benthica]MBE7213920.1 sulfotransferase family 2 domain-containing protein [Shewanella benthica]MCL1061826.1 sulfotransferase family 2 domain-containing protein [Shewanella benthica]